MSLVAVVIPLVGGFESDMQSFYDNHPLLTLDDVKVHSINDNGICLTYDNTKEQE